MRKSPILLGGMLLLATFALVPGASADTCAPAGGLGYEETCVSSHNTSQCAPETTLYQYDPEGGDRRDLHTTCVPYST